MLTIKSQNPSGSHTEPAAARQHDFRVRRDPTGTISAGRGVWNLDMGSWRTSTTAAQIEIGRVQVRPSQWTTALINIQLSG
jgi:hypothetical protein